MDLQTELIIKGERAEEIYETIVNTKPASQEKRKQRLKKFSEKIKNLDFDDTR